MSLILSYHCVAGVLSPQAGGAGVGVCLVGLHCCGSLANTIIKIFSEKLHTEIRVRWPTFIELCARATI